jgi:hypothetical protein
MPIEQWKPVRGYEGSYETSSAGRVRSVGRFLKGKNNSARHVKSQVLSPRIRDNGTPAVNLWRGNTYVQVAVKKIVLEAFDRPQPHGMEPSNVNGNLGDNRLQNLRWRLKPQRR